jgi:hypothetical protein
MDRGHELEPIALEAYELESFNTVKPGGFFELSEWVGCSPDGLIDQNGIVENKAPAFNTFIDYLLENRLPPDYRWQVQGQLFVTDRQWCDFIAFHPKLPLLTIRVYPDPAMFEQLKAALDCAIQEASEMINRIKSL